ncbi:MAG: hypothetical protein P8188_12565 [Gemmatimonadota bacterium]
MNGEVCIPNIGRKQRRLRLAVGLLGAASAVLMLAWLMLADAPRLLRLAVAAPAWLGAIGFLQHREKT